MARQKRRATGSTYDKRPVSGTKPPPPLPTDRLGSGDARELADRIERSQTRYKIRCIRLLSGGGCGVVVVDPVSGGEHVLETASAWDRLLITPAGAGTS